jgi:ParB family chromosome partitioning protein
MQPILVREKNDLGHHIIIHGARRYRGSKIAGKTTIPAIITRTGDCREQ